MRVLHIANWYPNVASPMDAPFIHRHVEAMRAHASQEIWHIAVEPGENWRLERRCLKADRTFVLFAPVRRARLIEWLTTALVLWAWLSRPRSVRPDVVNFYIAYPLCSHLRLLRTFIRRPMMMMEQWSGYHFNFRVDPSTPGLERARRIFRHRIPVICVSQSLATDLRTFSGVRDLPCPVVPNVVNAASALPPDQRPHDGTLRFFALAMWQPPKRPEVLIDALALLRERGTDVRLRFGGFGPQLDLVAARIARHGLNDRVEMIGTLTHDEVIREMQDAFAFVHCSDYETFSAVCAEALCCGTPVIASKVGGIPSFVNESNGVLVERNDPAVWAGAISGNWQRLAAMDRQTLAGANRAKFSPATVGARLHELFTRRAAGDPLTDA